MEELPQVFILPVHRMNSYTNKTNMAVSTEYTGVYLMLGTIRFHFDLIQLGLVNDIFVVVYTQNRYRHKQQNTHI